MDNHTHNGFCEQTMKNYDDYVNLAKKEYVSHRLTL